MLDPPSEYLGLDTPLENSILDIHIVHYSIQYWAPDSTMILMGDPILNTLKRDAHFKYFVFGLVNRSNGNRQLNTPKVDPVLNILMRGAQY